MKQLDILEHTFDKRITCPVCSSKFEIKCVKSKSPRILSKDSDFFIRYKSINPYFYDVWICNSCGYSAMKVDFPKIKSYQKDLVLKNITSKWKPRIYPDVMTEELAIEKYKLALITALSMEKQNSTIGMILIKISWMYRLLNNNLEELKYLSQALTAFENAYINENFPMYGLDRDSLTYLIGDLNRRLNNNDIALQWYSKVITTIGASYRVKELARTGKDSIKGN
nr:DUF2225 domain-containing protein [Clostridium paraputrificum]